MRWALDRYDWSALDAEVPVNGPPRPAVAGVADSELRREVSWGLPVYAEIAETGSVAVELVAQDGHITA
jgi:hypothetical protein